MILSASFEDWGASEFERAAQLMMYYVGNKFTITAGIMFDRSYITVNFNQNSDTVFLTNEDYQVLVLNDYEDKLDLFITTPSGSYEGTPEDLLYNYDDMENEDKEFVWGYLSGQQRKGKTKPE